MLSRFFPPELLTTREMSEAGPPRRRVRRAEFDIDGARRRGCCQGRGTVDRRPVRARVRVAVFCGPGNNGADGLLPRGTCARKDSIFRWICSVRHRSSRAMPRGRPKPGAKTILPFDKVPLDVANLVVSAIFGAGLSRDVDGEARAVILRLNDWTRRTRKPILSIDIPSGIDGSTGLVRGVAIEATQTITFFRLKPGHLLLPGQIHCGEISLVDIGIPESVLATIKPQTFANGPALWGAHYPQPHVDGHKYKRGHALVLSGSLAHTGAARLSARGCITCRCRFGNCCDSDRCAGGSCSSLDRDYDPRLRQRGGFNRASW